MADAGTGRYIPKTLVVYTNDYDDRPRELHAELYDHVFDCNLDHVTIHFVQTILIPEPTDD